MEINQLYKGGIKLEPIYLDLHIHTSSNPNNLNTKYDIDSLLDRINETASNARYLISLTDHNSINKQAYQALLEKTQDVLLGVELHIQNYSECKPYHCHAYFKTDILSSIDDINIILDRLYPDKEVTPNTENVPSLETIIKAFDKYEYMLLPHGGQSHSTFDVSIPKGVKFDTTLERNIYFNQFDGFTARSDNGLEDTINYFKRLGINEFVNLITCTDNYDPTCYPEAKDPKASPFIPTWMLAQPTFDGLRLSLSESSRLIYSQIKPQNWSEYIGKVELHNEKIDIDVNLVPGLNVVIGGSSSGKTLFVDSLYRKIQNDMRESVYSKYGVYDLSVYNPANCLPHYISQNFIMKVADSNNDEFNLDNIEIIKKVFPEDRDITETVDDSLAKLKSDLNKLIGYVKIIEDKENELSHIPVLTRLIVNGNIKENILGRLIPDNTQIAQMDYTITSYNQHISALDAIEQFVNNNPFVDSVTDEVKKIKGTLEKAYNVSSFETKIRGIVKHSKACLDSDMSRQGAEMQLKKQNYEALLQCVAECSNALKGFYETINSIAKYNINCASKTIESMGHHLYIQNSFSLSKEKVLEVINKYLKIENKISSFDKIVPQMLFEDKHAKKNPKVRDYKDFAAKIYSDFEKLNARKYKIIANDGRNFEELSAGWKTSVILDLILGYTGDIAPLIIDQPEDNLATNYINTGLIKAIKETKSRKQVILVSHNATIPMLGDAQNVILCLNKSNKLSIRSAAMEDYIDDKSMVDHIAEITDGGKPAIKKRVKKYNLKSFREE